MDMKQTGTVFDNHGLWYYSVKLPGEKKRRQVPLKAPGAKHTMRTDRPRKMALEAAARYWAEHTRKRAVLEREDAGITVEEVCAAWVAHAEVYYRHADGTPTGDKGHAERDVRLFREMYGGAAMSELTHRDMLRHRDALVRSGICRNTVNKRIGTVKRMIKWALEEALIPAVVKAELTQVANLKRGRSAARETPPVMPVADTVVEATLKFLMPNTADMVRVHRLTGMRPDEMCGLKWSRIDTSQTPWVYRPEHHKNEWRGQPRVIMIGPKARAILERHRDGEDAPFSPVRAVDEYLEAKRAARTSPFYPCRDENYSRVELGAMRKPGGMWNVAAYGRSISDACRRGGVEHWHPNQLRHAFATEVRREFGLEACRAVLGHSTGARITDRYSYAALEDETIRNARAAVETLG